MGDRSNIAIEAWHDGESKPRVYLYSHWRGWDIAYSAVAGLKSGRATDGPYLARVIFSHMIGDDIAGETGYGISPRIEDNEHPVIVIDPHAETVWLEDDEGNDLTEHVVTPLFIAAVERSDGYDRLLQELGPVPVPREKES